MTSKASSRHSLIKRLQHSVIFLALMGCVSAAHAQGTAFTYQGRLNDGANPANGTYNLRFALFDALTFGNQVGTPLTNSPVTVSNGLFTVTLDFGGSVFSVADRWLEIGVRTNGGGAFANLSPRQQITPSPYAIYAAGASATGLSGTIPTANLTGTYGSAVTFSNPGNSFSGNGTGLANVNAATLGGLGAANFWIVGGNAGTGGASLGTVDSQPLKLASGNSRVMLLETKVVIPGLFQSITAANVLGGANINTINSGVIGATIGGGGSLDVDGFLTTPHPNTVLDAFGTVGGGLGNTAGSADGDSSTSRAATVGGGENNGASGNHSFVGGGSSNGAGSTNSVIAGGAGNGISDSTFNIGAFTIPEGLANGSCIGGGENNVILTYYDTFLGFPLNLYHSFHSSIGGGLNNTVYGASYAAIPGGLNNTVAGSFGLAAGRRAKANHIGAFVWADSTDTDFASTGANQFAIRASGGVQLDPLTSIYFGTQTRQALNVYGTDYGIGSQYDTLYFRCANFDANSGFIWYRGGVHNDNYVSAGGAGGGTEMMHLVASGLYVNGSVVLTSDRNAKENFAPISPREVLEKVAALPISRWNYKEDKASEHLGPMAQDFYAAFGVGPDDKHIATVDADGVALAAIQGLNQKLEEQRAENAGLKARLEKLERLMNRENRGAK